MSISVAISSYMMHLYCLQMIKNTWQIKKCCHQNASVVAGESLLQLLKQCSMFFGHLCLSVFF